MVELLQYNSQDIINRIDCRDLMRRFYPRHFVRSRSRYDIYRAFNRDDGSKPALRVYANGVKDFGGSGQHWNAFQLTAEALKLDVRHDFPKICTYLSSGDMPIADVPRLEKSKINHAPPSKAWQEAMMPYLQQWQDNLWQSPNRLAYLRDERGLSDETIRHFGLGYNPEWTYIRMDGDIIVVAPGIMLPWFAYYQLYAVRIRTFEPHLDKYMSVSGSKPSAGLFNADAIQAGQEVTIVEGEFDCMLAHQHGIATVTRGSTSDHRNLSNVWLDRLQTASVVYGLLDNDKAGQGASDALFEKVDNFVPLALPNGNDLTDYVQGGGDVAAIFKQAKSATIQAQRQRAKDALWWTGMMPDSWRSALLQYFPASVAPLVELIHEAARQSYINPLAFTINEILEHRAMLGLHLAEGTIRRLFKVVEGVFFSKFNIINTQETMLKNENKSHRAPITYRLLPLSDVQQQVLRWAKPRIIESLFSRRDREQLVTIFSEQMLVDVGYEQDEAQQIAQLLNTKTTDFRLLHESKYQRRLKKTRLIYMELEGALSNIYSTELPPVPIYNAKDYRAVYARAQVEAGETHRSGRELAQVLGVRREYVGEVLKHGGISNKDHYEDVEITTQNVENLDRIAYDVQGYPRSIQVDNHYLPYDEQADVIINEAIANGQQVQVRYQVASEQIIARDEVLVEPSPKTETPSEPEQCEQTELDELTEAQREVKERKPKPRSRYYGASFNPEWVKHHLVLTLHIARLGYLVRDNRLIDTRTGEVLRDDASISDLMAILQGRQLDAFHANTSCTTQPN